jgi:exopolysaccharide biosynthesis polyprenyl glycosylphosphotransferase
MSEQFAARTPHFEQEAALQLARAPSKPSARNRDTALVRGRATLDAIGLVVAATLVERAQQPAHGVAWHAVTIALTVAAFAAAGAYQPRLRLALGDELRRVVTASALVALAAGALAMLTTSGTGAGDVAVVQWLVASALVSTGRVALYGAQRLGRTRSDFGGRTLIIGAGEVGSLTATRLLAEPQLGLRPVGFLDKDPLPGPRGPTALPVLGASWDLEDVIRRHRIEHVVVAFSKAPHHVLLGIVRRCWALHVAVHVVPRLYEVEGRRMQVEHLGALPLVQLGANDPRGWQMSVKYALDRVVSAFFLLACAPILAAVAVAILVTMGRPVFFRQRRVGRDGHSFEMLKFRTMRGSPETDGEADARWASQIVAGPHLGGHAPSGGDRSTALGSWLRRLGIDELPQLWNVLRGDMSLVGPRPEREGYVQRFGEIIYRYPERHRMKSGLTGWAQVHGLRGETSLADRIEWDNFYIENWSPWLDLEVLLRTLPAVLVAWRAEARSAS